MLTSSIIKLDRPYPIVYYKGRLLLQVGTLLVVSDKLVGDFLIYRILTKKHTLFCLTRPDSLEIRRVIKFSMRQCRYA